ncbi:MAG: phage tail protein [Betaproteobacteria bacterium]|nr:phage tail protein [Betaproteobacteria bacterium]
MSQPYIGEIRLFAGNFAPVGWSFCEGQTLAIAENDVLFNLIGTTYGGDGQVTFNLPDLRGRIPLHMGTGAGLSTRTIGELSGTESVTLSVVQMPTHNHQALASTGLGHLSEPEGAVPAAHRDFPVYDAAATTTMGAAVQVAGGSQPHENMPPYLCVSFIISLYGVYPSTN